MAKLTIDGQQIEIEDGATVIQAAEKAGIEIPHFCYHNRLDIAGNCRMCLVDIEGAPKPIASCAWPVANDMVVHTRSERAEKARKGVMEFLLINHPLDCPICDQGGECDLQDQAMAYGKGVSRYDENKRAVRNKYMGPIVKTYMNRCIHCTRCVRFAHDVAGVPEMGAVNRGEAMEIVTYLDRPFSSEMSGNVIDLCPVGALTSRPYQFRGRPWELTKTESIDVMDAVGSNIRVDTYGPKVMRVMPRLHEDVNEEWISDKTRYACDGLGRQRLDIPYVRVKGKLQAVSWDEAFTTIKKKLKGVDGSLIAAIAGDQADCESMFALKDLMAGLSSPNLDCRQDGAAHINRYRSHYLFNTTIAGIDEADACLIIGATPRYEAPIINARLLKRQLQGGFPIAHVGAPLDSTFKVEELGDQTSVLDEIASGKHPFSKILKSAKKPMLIIGNQALCHEDADKILATAGKIADDFGFIGKDWNGFNVLHTAASRVGGLDVGFVPGKEGAGTAEILNKARDGDLKAVYLLGADEVDMSAFKKTFVIYQGHHGDAGAHAADVILPGAAYTEKSGTYVNTEGRVQRTQQATFPPGEAHADWRIVRALAGTLGVNMNYDSLDDLRASMAADNPVFASLDTTAVHEWMSLGKATKLKAAAIPAWDQNFYMTDPISRHSPTMLACSKEFGFIETEGDRAHA
ncbi:MAG: NADH-quinone oxidoreductase subunit NuoG [Alphaproteobacteria bacterium]